jgi:hypothetical protein
MFVLVGDEGGLDFAEVVEDRHLKVCSYLNAPNDNVFIEFNFLNKNGPKPEFIFFVVVATVAPPVAYANTASCSSNRWRLSGVSFTP